MRQRTFAGALCALVLASAACGSDDTTGTTSPTPSGNRIASTAKISIERPRSGEVVTGSSLVVEVAVEGARVLEQASTNIRPDTGHMHLSLDGKTVTLLAGLRYELKDLTPGPHLLQAEFAAADHGPFNPRVIATASFTVR